jgi:hypothetical protein
MRILFAINKTTESKHLLKRSLPFLSNHTVKTAGYYGYCDKVDININAFVNPNSFLFFDKLSNYYNEVKRFNPELIITDCEPVTSFLATYFTCPVYQIINKFFHYAITTEYQRKAKLKKHVSSIYRSGYPEILKNADRVFVYSHFGDLGLQLKDNVTWIRPYFKLGKTSKVCAHDHVVLVYDYRKILSNIKSNDLVIYYDKNFTMNHKSYDSEDYYHNIKNAKYIITESCSHLLADCYYNGKYPHICMDISDMSSISNTYLSDYYYTGKRIYIKDKLNLSDLELPEVFIEKDIKYLHEYL